MQLLYVVALEVRGTDAFERAIGHIENWMVYADPAFDVREFREDGFRALPLARFEGVSIERTASWEVLEEEDERAFKLVVSQPVETDIQLSTRFTVGTTEYGALFRASIARAHTGSSLRPVSETTVFQPNVVRQLAYDAALALTVDGQHVEARYLPIKTLDEAAEVVQSIKSDNRLPFVLVHVRSPQSWDLAKLLARGLVGLARVLTLNYSTSRAIAAALPDVRTPFGGLLLAWPGRTVTPWNMAEDLIAELGPEAIQRQLLQLLGGMSALGRGTDTVWQAARTRQNESLMATLLADAASARERSDTDAEILALRAQVDVLRKSERELGAIGEEALQRADAGQHDADVYREQRDAAEREARMWRDLYNGERATAEPEDDDDPWELIPDLVPGADPQQTFLALADAAADRIAFTPTASKSWSKIRYPEPDDMTRKLVKLARAAVDLYGDEEQTMGHVDNWFKEAHDLNVALTDQKIATDKSLRWVREFEFDEVTLDATPHVKVRDGVKPNECGRIHFAFDKRNRRIVVHHVAVKTYKM